MHLMKNEPIPQSHQDDLSFATTIARTLSQPLNRSSTAVALLPSLVRLLSLQGAGLVIQTRGVWELECWGDHDGGVTTGRNAQPSGYDSFSQSNSFASNSLPDDLISEAVDSGQPRYDGGWYVTPCQIDLVEENQIVTSPLVTCLVLSAPSSSFFDAIPISRINHLSELMITAVLRAELSHRHRQRIDQLAKLLEAAATWQQGLLNGPSKDPTVANDEILLRQIADTATDLADCERASIFLWDKRRKKLIGRPALGIDGTALEVPDNAGVVGEVLSTKEPQIWNANSDDESRVNRNIDRTLEFETDSLVAVPLINSRGDTIGVFEALNHRKKHFDNSHVLLLSDLATHAAVAIESQNLQQTLTESRDRLVRDAASSTSIIGNHTAITAVRDSGTKVAKTDLTVLVLGSNGTGKEVVARHVHYESERRNGPFVAVNCAALVESLLESELFGHEKGAFTDANSTRVGKFELAHGGTLFLDEVGDMSPGGQAKLLRVLEQKEVVRVGGSTPILVDVRVIAATNQPLEQLIAEKRFREDLFFRLNVVSLTLPDLADRGRDVLLLAEHFLQHFCNEIGRKVPTLNHSAQTALLSYPWPGNVRELRNTIERVCYLTSGDELAASDLDLRSAGQQPLRSEMSGGAKIRVDLPDSLAESTRIFQVDHIKSAIDSSGGNMTEAAAKLDLHRSNLYRKMKQLGMRTNEDVEV